MNEPVGDPKIETQNSKFKNRTPPIVWTIAGSDPGGGAGIQIDLKTMNAFGVHGCSVITAFTAQNTLGVQATEAVSGSMLRAQLDALQADLPPAAIKTGMLGSASTCEMLADFLATPSSKPQIPNIPLVCDPILTSTSGTELLSPDAIEILIERIFPKTSVLTPNLVEAQMLIGGKLTSVEGTAERLLETGVGSVLIKGGHADGTECSDYWTDGMQAIWFSSPRIDTKDSHGTGCILSAAIASAMARGTNIPDAIATAKTFLNQCLRTPTGLGCGHGPMHILPFRNDPKDRPTIH